MGAATTNPRDEKPNARFGREAILTGVLLLALGGVAFLLNRVGRAYLLVFSMNVSMVTLVLTLVIYRRYRDWRVLPLALLFLWATVQQTAIAATEILGLRPKEWIAWLAAAPLVVPTFLGFAAVVYLWRVFQVQADLDRRERELAERALRAQRLETLGVMAGGVAHDFSNLLTTILGHTALLQMDAPQDSDVAASARSIQQAAERAGAISRQMLDYTGCGKFRVEAVDLVRLCERVRPLLESFVHADVTLRFRNESDITPLAEGDPSQLEQVLVNLVTNAAEATTERGGTITVSLAFVEATEAMLADGANSDPLPAGRYVQLSVEDTGTGMDENVRQRMFDPFFGTRATGRGMGLAAVLGIVRGHHGTIRVRTALGRGTTVQVLLPEATGQAEKAAFGRRSPSA